MHLSGISESLEARRLFAIPVSGGVATINGTAAADVLEVIVSSGTLQVRNGAGTVIDSVSASGITRIDVNGGSGNDFIRLGRGDGSLMPAVRAVIAGNAGNDTLIGGNGNDSIFGGGNDDRIDGRAGGDLIDGQEGFDTVDYSYRTVPVRVTLASGANDGSNSGNNSSIGVYNDNGGDNCVSIEAAVGGTGADSLIGNSSTNWLDGGGGNDTILGGAGIDTIIGGVQNDLAYGEGDDDTFLMKDGAADQFLGTPGITFAQYDAVDTPAPAIASASAVSTATLRTFSTALTTASTGGTLVLDPAFGLNADGKQVVSSGAGSIYINDVALVEDGKFIAVGSVGYASEAPSDFVVIRFNPDGSLDTSFGENQNGFVFTDFSDIETGSTEDYANSVTIDSQGRIVVAGSVAQGQFLPDESFQYTSEFGIARYLPDGLLDTSFGVDGIGRIDPNGFASYDSANRIVTQHVFNGETFEEMYLVAGSAEGFDTSDFALIRLNEWGNVDYSFGEYYNNGLVLEDFGDGETGTSDAASGLAVDPETGNIWLSGTADDSLFAIVGYDSNGISLGFGKNTYDFEYPGYAAHAVIADNKLIVVGSIGTEGYGAGAIVAQPIDAVGEAVTSIVEDPNFGYVSFSSVSIDNDGTGVAVGDADNDFYIHRFNVSDLSAVGTAQAFDLYESTDTGGAVVVQPDGKYLIVGTFNYQAVGMIRVMEEDTGEEWVDVDLGSDDIQTPGFFTFVNENGDTQPVPSYLVWRYTKLADDGTWTIEGTDVGETYEVFVKDGIVSVVRDGEYWQEPVEFVTKIVIKASGGNDSVRIDSSVQVPVVVNAGEGNDTVRGSSMGDEINGDGGNDILLGLGGDDSINGGSGRDVIIGGQGKDSLNGDAGEDVLVAGVTLWDNSPSALQRLGDEWFRTDLNYSKRVKNLTTGGGRNGIITLNALTTFSSRQIPDVLTGGSDTDAFWGNFSRNGDRITDSVRNEVINNAGWLF